MTSKIPLTPLILACIGVGWIGATAFRRPAPAHSPDAIPMPPMPLTQAPSQVTARIRRLDHDLRTPIGTIATALHLLRASGTGTAGPDEETMQVLERQVARLTAIADSLRDLAASSARPGSGAAGAARETFSSG